MRGQGFHGLMKALKVMGTQVFIHGPSHQGPPSASSTPNAWRLGRLVSHIGADENDSLLGEGSGVFEDPHRGCGQREEPTPTRQSYASQGVPGSDTGPRSGLSSPRPRPDASGGKCGVPWGWIRISWNPGPLAPSADCALGPELTWAPPRVSCIQRLWRPLRQLRWPLGISWPDKTAHLMMVVGSESVGRRKKGVAR